MPDAPHVPSPRAQSSLPSPQLTCAVLDGAPLAIQRAAMEQPCQATKEQAARPAQAPVVAASGVAAAPTAPVSSDAHATRSAATAAAVQLDSSDGAEEQTSLIMLSEPSSLYTNATTMTESTTGGVLQRPAQAVSAPVTAHGEAGGDAASTLSSSTLAVHEPRRHSHDALVLAEARREVASPVLFSTHTRHAPRMHKDDLCAAAADNDEAEAVEDDFFTSTSRAALQRLRRSACQDDEADRCERRAHRRHVSCDATHAATEGSDERGTVGGRGAMRMRFVLPTVPRTQSGRAASTTQASTAATSAQPPARGTTGAPPVPDAVELPTSKTNETTNEGREVGKATPAVAERVSTPPRKRVKLSLSHLTLRPESTSRPAGAVSAACAANEEEKEEAEAKAAPQQQQASMATSGTTRKLRLLRVTIKEPPPGTPTQQAGHSANAAASVADSSVSVCSPRSVRAAVSAFTEERQAARRPSAERPASQAILAEPSQTATDKEEPASPTRNEAAIASNSNNNNNNNATTVAQTTLSGPGFGSLTHSVQSFASPTSSPSPYYGLNTPARRMHSATHIPLPTAPLAIDFGSVTHTVEDYYEVTAKISEGTYGEVYRGKDRRTGAQVALKRLKTLRGLDGFPITSLREVIALQHINRQRARLHRQRAERAQNAHSEADKPASAATAAAEEEEDSLDEIVTLCDVLLSKEDTHDIYLVFTYASSSLAGLLSRRFPFTLSEIAYVFRKITLGVFKLHEMGIIHRDIKSDNILLTAEATVQLTDFGLCVFARSGKRAMTPSLINLAYRPPEMLLGSMEYDAKVDVWSIGCLLAQVFLGVPPFYRAATNSDNAAGGGARQQVRPQDHRSADTELSQLALICEVLGPITRLPSNTFSESSCRHLTALRHMQQLYLSGQDYMADTSDLSLDSTQVKTGKSLTQLQPLFEASFLYTRYNGFRRWFLSALENRRARHARAKIHNPQANIPPLLMPSQSCLDVMTRIFQLDPRRRPTAAELLNMPLFQLKADDTTASTSSVQPSILTTVTDNTLAQREALVRQALRQKLAGYTDSHLMPHAAQ